MLDLDRNDTQRSIESVLEERDDEGARSGRALRLQRADGPIGLRPDLRHLGPPSAIDLSLPPPDPP